jgi:uncharacterized membrane protein
MSTDSTNPAVTIQVSFDWLKLASIGLVCVGWICSFYLAWLKLTHVLTLCPPGNSMSCESVVASIYAKVGPVPVAYLGVVGNLVILAALLFEAYLPSAELVIFGLTLFGFLFSDYLTAVEAFVLHAWCQLCVLIALAMTSLFVVSFIRLRRAISAFSDDEAVDATV